MDQIQATIITIGDELLIGQVIDTNSAFIAQKLNAIGVQVQQRIAVGDDTRSITNALDTAIQNNLKYICAETLTADLQVVQNLSSATASSVEVDELISTLISIEKLN